MRRGPWRAGRRRLRRSPRGLATASGDAPSAVPVVTVSTEITSYVVDVSGYVERFAPPARPRRDPRARSTASARRRLGSSLGIARRFAVRSDVRPQRAPIIATGQGQAVPARRRSVAADAAHAARPRNRSRVLQGRQGPCLLATANPGKLFRLSPQRALPRGTYESEVRDAQMVATWGTAQLARRRRPPAQRSSCPHASGNTETPDDTWSAWSGTYHARRRRGDHEPEGALPPVAGALTGKGDGPVLTSVTAAYLQRNLRPRVDRSRFIRRASCFRSRSRLANRRSPASTTSHARSQADVRGSRRRTRVTASPRLGRAGIRRVCRRSSGRPTTRTTTNSRTTCCTGARARSTWKPLKRGVTDPIFVWDTTSVPNGTYFVKIVASDAPATRRVRRSAAS